MVIGDEPIVNVLLSLANTVKWLRDHEPISSNALPTDQIPSIKKLETLGLVCRSGSGHYHVQRERLRKLLKRTFEQSSVENQRLCIAAYGQSFAPAPDHVQ